MVILISMALAFLMSWYGGRIIKKEAKMIYIGAAALGAAVVGVTWTGAYMGFPGWVRTWVWPILSRGALATAIFMVVMFTGALPKGSTAIKRLMPIRAELSIAASILILGHNIAYGKTYFVRLFTDPLGMPGTQLTAAVCSVILILIMLPLAVTSFPSVRKRMNPKRWKRLQRSAYVFYALIYVHVMLLYVPRVQGGKAAYIVNVLIYSVVFFTYAAMRLRKALIKYNPAAANMMPAVFACLLAATCILCCIRWGGEQTTGADGRPAERTARGLINAGAKSEEKEWRILGKKIVEGVDKTLWQCYT